MEGGRAFGHHCAQVDVFDDFDHTAHNWQQFKHLVDATRRVSRVWHGKAWEAAWTIDSFRVPFIWVQTAGELRRLATLDAASILALRQETYQWWSLVQLHFSNKFSVTIGNLQRGAPSEAILHKASGRM